MKLNKLLVSAVVATALTAIVTTSFAGSIGRAGGSSSGGRSSSSSVSHSSSPSAPSKSTPAPSVAPAPAKSGGIGGTTSSVGVRKSEVTNGVRNDVAATKPAPTGTSTGSSGSYSPSYAPTPTYSAPAVPQPQVTNGSTFMSSLGGSFAGTILGNSLFGNHGHSGGTTVINNGTPSNGTVSSGPGTISSDAQFNPGGVNVQPKKEYTVWSFIADLFGFVIVVALLLGIAWLFYKGFQLVRNYINKERGVSNIPFNPTQQFWRIQRAFAEADVTELKVLLGPDVVDELTNGLSASTLTLHNVSHEVRLANNTEFSIWYKFEDDGSEVNQVWHYEKFGKDWKLNGIENV